MNPNPRRSLSIKDRAALDGRTGATRRAGTAVATLSEREHQMDHSRVWPATSHPDSAAARQIKGLVTRNQNLHWKVTRLTERLESKGLVLPRKTRNALDWVLMPDQRRNADEEKWDEAAKLWTALKDTSDRAGRQDALLHRHTRRLDLDPRQLRHDWQRC